MSSLSDRVTWLIKRYYRGNVSAAAKAIGLPQPTLARIAEGSVVNPRANALSLLASRFEVTIDWLVRGVGEGPPEVTPEGLPMTGEEVHLVSFMHSLPIDNDLRYDLVMAANLAVRWWQGFAYHLAQINPEAVDNDQLIEAVEAHRESWRLAIGALTVRHNEKDIAPLLESMLGRFAAPYAEAWEALKGIPTVQDQQVPVPDVMSISSPASLFPQLNTKHPASSKGQRSKE